MSTLPHLPPQRPLWRRILRRVLRIVAFLLVLVLGALLLRCFYAFHDRNPGYQVNLDIHGHRLPTNAIERLHVGFARVKINPDLADRSKPIYLAGFNQNRVATKIHDDLWAIACVIDDGKTRLGIVALDAIGFFHDDVIEVRKRLYPLSRIDYAIVCSTHNHSTPDLLGLWGPDYLHTGVNETYRMNVVLAAAKALDRAAAALQPARMAIHEIYQQPDGLVADTRDPQVFDSDIRVMHFTTPTNGATIGSIVNWANHPETVWSRNTEITADYPGYLRDALEEGVSENKLLLRPGVGGIHMFVNGAVGGLMSTTPSVKVRDPFLEREFETPSHEKARAVGHALAARVLPKLENTNAITYDHVPISIRARTIPLALDNNGFLFAPIVGLIDRGHIGWKQIRTEVAMVAIGKASIACVPGEIYPEIVNGGIDVPFGADYQTNILEVPPLRDVMPGKVKFVFGLANDEIGYIIPKTEFDRKAPYLYGAKKAPYGEINSVGPDTAPAIHSALMELATGLVPTNAPTTK